MSTSRSRSFGVLTLLTALMFAVVTFFVLPSVTKSASPSLNIRVKPVGNPTWAPVDFHMFSAPVGTASSGYAEFGETMQALLPPPNHEVHPVLGIGPGAPHWPPYDSEFASSVAAQGYHEGSSFAVSEISNGSGVFLVWMNVPAPGTTGSSPDFASGPIIPNSLFPIHVVGNSIHNGAPFSVLGEFDVLALDELAEQPFDVDGHSHFPIFFADNADFGPPNAVLEGKYVWQISMIDASRNGWKIVAHFTVGQ